MSNKYIRVSPENMNLIETLANHLISKGVRPCMGDPEWDNIHATIYNSTTKQYTFRLSGEPDTLYRLEFGVINKILTRVHRHFDKVGNEKGSVGFYSNRSSNKYIKVSPDDVDLIETLANHLISKGVRPCMGDPEWDKIHATIYNSATKQYTFRLTGEPDALYRLQFGVINKILTRVHRHFDDLEDDGFDDDFDDDDYFNVG